MRIITFASGSSGNCVLVSMGESHILLDAGISFKRIKDQLSLSGLTPGELSAVLITHEHSDHISGLGTMVKRCAVPVFAPRTVANHLRAAVPGIEHALCELPVGEDSRVGSVAVRAFHTPHDTPESVGYRLSAGGETFALATDMGEATEEIKAGLLGADAVLIESNHDVDMLRMGPYPAALKRRILSEHGHLSNENCAALAARLAESGTRYIILGHLSRENNTPSLAYRTVSAALEGFHGGVQLCVAPASERLTVEAEAAVCSR